MADVSMFGDKLRNNIHYQMFGSVPVIDTTVTEINQSIEEIKAMIDYCIRLNNKEEIAFWRGALQNAKNVKRSIVNT